MPPTGPMKRANEKTGNPSKRQGAHTEGITQYSPEDLESFPFDIETLVEPPPADTTWHPAARRMYEAMLRDPARIWMGPTAWAITWIMAENMSREMYPQVIGVVEGGVDPETGERIPGHVAREVIPMKGTSINALMSWAKANGVHEQDRLALRKEVTLNTKASTNDDVGDVSGDVVPIRPGYFQTPKEA